MESIRTLCNRGILLEDGKLTFSGSAHETVSAYLSHLSDEQREISWPFGEGPGNPFVQFTNASVRGLIEREEASILSGDPVELRFTFHLNVEEEAHYSLTFHLYR